MYIVNTPARNRAVAGDRANNRVVVFHGLDFQVEATVPTGSGVWHMRADAAGDRLWVVNDLDRTATVIDPRLLIVLATVPMPEDLGAIGARPYDVVLSN